MNWLFTSLQWYLVLFVIGWVFFPLTQRLFSAFRLDLGYSFAKIIGILVLSYVSLVLGVTKILPFYQLTLWFLLAVTCVITIYLWTKGKLNSYLFPLRESTGTHNKTVFFIIIQEVLFLSSFLFWTFVRGQEPSIHGLEKFMDFGFMNSILRSVYFPPLDMWYSSDPTHPAGFPINYYYFGHLTGALLIKLSGVNPAMGYNLILSTIFALSMTQTFSLIINIISYAFVPVKNSLVKNINILYLILAGLFGSYVLNLGGNLHTIYLFTTGYPNDKPLPFWQVLSTYHPEKYWYPNATRFIPFTIHEFPSYSYVVADLHGHVFDIPYVLLTVSVLFIFFITHFQQGRYSQEQDIQESPKKLHKLKTEDSGSNNSLIHPYSSIFLTVSLGLLCAVHYMTNAFDGPIYILFSLAVLFLIYYLTPQFFLRVFVLLASFIIFSLPFSVHFSPFVSGIGVNCSPEFLVKMGKLGPFLFEKGNCQSSPWWMLGILWGFFWIHFIVFGIVIYKELRNQVSINRTHIIDLFILMLFVLGTFLIIIPEFFYMKDIYPAHFRANTMFKLGYQAFMLMSIASTYTLWRFKSSALFLPLRLVIQGVLIAIIFLVTIYPFFSVPSYYGKLDRPVVLDGSEWLTTSYPQDKELIDYINNSIKGNPVVLEAQGDSYTDYERISAYTGLPTVAGWWVHEWLWRGSSDIVGKRIPDIVTIYESQDIQATRDLIKKYNIRYIVVSDLEREKYPNLNSGKIASLGRVVFKSQNSKAVLYEVK
jgi:YYY domain-containing protein